jgi:hypothetical protein
MATGDQLSALIVEELAAGEKGVLSLVVAIRKTLGPSRVTKSDVSKRVDSALRKLVASKVVVDQDGRYSLASRQ